MSFLVWRETLFLRKFSIFTKLCFIHCSFPKSICPLKRIFSLTLAESFWATDPFGNLVKAYGHPTSKYTYKYIPIIYIEYQDIEVKDTFVHSLLPWSLFTTLRSKTPILKWKKSVPKTSMWHLLGWRDNLVQKQKTFRDLICYISHNHKFLKIIFFQCQIIINNPFLFSPQHSPCFGLRMGNGSPSFQKKYIKVSHKRQEKSSRCLCTEKEETRLRLNRYKLKSLLYLKAMG